MTPECCFLAYLDPGTGSLILQALLAAALSTGVLLRRFLLMPLHWLFGKRKRRPDEPTELYE